MICFVDDDPAEICRFEKAMSSRFLCVTATSYEACKERLRTEKRTPDLWVLDLFFPSAGHTNSPAQLEQMADKYAELEQRIRDFRAYLASIGQGIDGGLGLLKRCLRDYRAPVVMFTRKGTLDDAIQCFDDGATDVLKKPMPPELSGTYDHKLAQLDDAMMAKAAYLEEHFHEAIRTNTFWYRHKAVILFVFGAVLSAATNRLVTYLLI